MKIEKRKERKVFYNDVNENSAEVIQKRRRLKIDNMTVKKDAIYEIEMYENFQNLCDFSRMLLAVQLKDRGKINVGG